MAAKKDNSRGLYGVVPNARLYAVKVLNSRGSGSLSQVISGVNWVTNNAARHNIRVANMSLGFAGTSSSLDAAISNSVDAGVTYVVAAGNSASDAAGFSPANHPQVITVSAMGDSDGLGGGQGIATSDGFDDSFASFSNYGQSVEIAGPGVDILSTYKDGMYATLSGTSMASPHVAGAAARYILRTGDANPMSVRWALVANGSPQSGGDGFSGDPDSYPEPLVYAGSQ